MRRSMSRCGLRSGSSRSGFTLIEAVVALAVVVAGLAWLVSGSGFAGEATGLASDRTRATTYAAGLVERIQSGEELALEGGIEELPGGRWELEHATPSGQAPGCEVAVLTVSFDTFTGEREGMRLTFLGRED